MKTSLAWLNTYLDQPLTAEQAEPLLTDVGFPFDGVDELALSTGSACMSGSGEPSHVLRSMGLPADRLRGSVRFGLSRFNTAAEVDHVAARLAEAVSHLRRLAPETGIR